MQPVLDKNDVFFKKVQKCFLQFSPPLHTYSNLFNLFQNAISPKVCVSEVLVVQPRHTEPGLAPSGSGLAAGHSLPSIPAAGLAQPRAGTALNTCHIPAWLLASWPEHSLCATPGRISASTSRVSLCYFKLRTQELNTQLATTLH